MIGPLAQGPLKGIGSLARTIRARWRVFVGLERDEIGQRIDKAVAEVQRLTSKEWKP